MVARCLGVFNIPLPEKTRRNILIHEYALGGVPVACIAQMYKISYNRVRVIVRREETRRVRRSEKL